MSIGPTEVGSLTRFLAAGDFDGDSHRDLALAIQILGDTSEGNPRPGQGAYDLRRVVVFWGNGTGRFSLDDTTRLGNPHEIWISGFFAVACDFSGIGTSGLALLGSYTMRDGVPVRTARMHVYQAPRGRRWGRDGTPRTPAWQWWEPPKFNMLRTLDQDGDGAVDLIMINNEPGHGPIFSSIAVLYGRRGVLPDTSELEFLNPAPDSVNQLYYMDVTGDRIAELVTASGDRGKIFVYLGLRGQRLREQYGSGEDPPRPDDSAWWGRPWAEIWTPGLIEPGWFYVGFDPIYDLGDVGLDGVGDICVNYNYSTILCYNGGRFLDSLFDSWILLPGWGPSDVTAVSVLGDIDGSGLQTIGIGYYLVPTADRDYPGAVEFVQPSGSVPRWGRPRTLPPGTDRPSVIISHSGGAGRVHGWVYDRWLHLRWRGTAPDRIELHDVQGRQLRRWDSGRLPRLDASIEHLPAGAYILSAHFGDRLETLKVLVLDTRR